MLLASWLPTTGWENKGQQERGRGGCARCFLRKSIADERGLAVEDVDAVVGGGGSFCNEGAEGRRERADDDARSS